MTAVFYLDARVLAQPLLTPAWCTEFSDLISRVRTLYEIELVVVTPPHLHATPRRYIDLLGAEEIIGATRALPSAISAAVTIDANVRAVRGVTQGWLLTDVGDVNRLRRANFPIRILDFGVRVEPCLVTDVEEVLYEYAKVVGW